ncbi:hypothetical protein FAGAP_12908 [Fusarium agapanthi]|uniref:NACHT domain-containing protein n=1 Tax=Fusarium agapanthi TaxID=1803897 RepID=A0A9P5AWS2_9HYPO|nr:hypothetical protein FAGAP_12908 [Fusarium agapanthi]
MDRPSLASNTVAAPETTRNDFPDGVKIWHSPRDAGLDICFIHGLSGNRDKTWTAPGQPNPRPAELLPSRLAKARLLTYGYDAYVLKESVSSTNRLIDHANNLLHDLAAERASSGIINRPLIFVVHSFGGIVCKTALVISRQSPESHLGQHLGEQFQYTALLSEESLLQFDANGQWLSASFVELWQILIKVADSNPNTEIICLIDEVDECNEQERSQLFKMLCELRGSNKSLNLKFLITSRPYREIGIGFKPLENLNLPVIHLSGESDAEMRKIVKEIDIAIRERVKTIGVQQTLTDDEQLILITRLLCVQNRTYLWAHLTLDLIERQLDISKEKIINITSHLPQNVNEAYERILCRTFSKDKATRMLHLIIAANRPLTVGEMIVALELQQHHQSIDDI